eukprot:SAG31_NODE_2591_length_5425_cov_4.004694_5_plen_120_part_00
MPTAYMALSWLLQVHSSWVRYVNSFNPETPFDPEMASGILFRMDPGSTLCPMAHRSGTDQLEAKIKDAVDLMQGKECLTGFLQPKEIFYKAQGQLYLQFLRCSTSLPVLSNAVAMQWSA